MTQYRKRPLVIEAFTFDEFLEFGRGYCQQAGLSLVGKMPWSFKFRDYTVTHENDACYLIPTLEGTMKFTPDDVLIVGVANEIYPCKRDIFERTYEPLVHDGNWEADPGVIAGKDGNPVFVAAAGTALQDICHHLSKSAGWWKAFGMDLTEIINNPRDPWEKMIGGALVAQKLCLSHSEISEAMEGHRKGLMDDKLPHRQMIEVEIADAVIRLFDLAGALNLDVGGAIAEKLAFNQKRPDHKPENRAKEGGKAY